MSNFGEKFASRFNSFVLKGDTVYDAIEKIKTIPGVTHLEFNYPEHFKDTEVSKIKEMMGDLQVNGVATRFKPPKYLNGEFSHYDDEIRKESIELAKGAVDKGCLILLRKYLGRSFFTVRLVGRASAYGHHPCFGSHVYIYVVRIEFTLAVSHSAEYPAPVCIPSENCRFQEIR